MLYVRIGRRLSGRPGSDAEAAASMSPSGRRHLPPVDEFLDLRGIACPINWAMAKSRLESMAPGQVLELLTTDRRAASDIPRAAETEGFFVIEVIDETEALRIIIER
jgi:tRNA 2-thiouridine synthesizing protein A